MKSFFWRLVICLVPLLLGGLIVGNAFRKYYAGEGGFKLGVDLVGGTILIYEVDVTKFENGTLPNNWDPQELARRLKTRIDPNDLYNITIRVASDTRFEIILPTGGQHQIQAEQEDWHKLLEEVTQKYPVKTYDVPVGQKTELVAAVFAQHPDEKVADVRAFIDENYKPAADADDAAKAKAWKELLTKVKDEYPPKSYEVARGAFDQLVQQVAQQHPDAPLPEISQAVDPTKFNRGGGSMTSEDVEERKELIAQVGSLRFVILANQTNDNEALQAAREYFTKVRNEDEAAVKALEEANLLGKAPPAPQPPDQIAFDTELGPFTYRWVELGPVYRYDRGLANPRDSDGKLLADPQPNDLPRNREGNVHQQYSMWFQAKEAREANRLLELDGSLVYSREIPPGRALRLPEKDREKTYEYFILTRNSGPGVKEVTGDDLAYARQGELGSVAFGLKPAPADRFYELTSKNVGHLLAVELDGMIESAARIDSAIRASGQITGQFKPEDIAQLVRVLRSGSLPATLKRDPVSENTMGPTLGADTIRSGGISVMIAFGLILVFMVSYYRFAGIVASIALLGNLTLTIAFMIVIDATFTLPGIAGLVLTMGMVVDSNILIYERIREERERGANLTMAVRTGYERAFSTIIDTHLSSIFTAVVLYVVGNDQLRGFGISLTVGLTISLFTTLYLTRVIFDLGVAKGWVTELKMMKLLSRPSINFMKYRFYFFTATVLFTIVFGALFVSRLDEGGLNIDFVGGTAYTGELKEPMSIDAVRDKLADADLPDLNVEQIFISAPGYTDGNKSKLFTVRTSLKGEDSVAKVEQVINEHLGEDLKRISLGLGDPILQSSNKEAIFAFTDPNTGNPAFASPAQVRMTLNRKLEDHIAEVRKEADAETDSRKRAQVLAVANELQSTLQQYVLLGLGKDKDGRFAWMKFQVPKALEHPDELKTILSEVKTNFEQDPQPERLENFDSQLAKETQLRALYAILASWGAILLYLWFRFGNWTFGLAAVLCLIHDLFFTLGIIAICHYAHSSFIGSALMLHDFKIDLPTVAALLTLVGYSVNDTIVVFDRIREVRGKNPALTPGIINDSINQTLSRTLLSSFTTFLVVIVLYIWGGDGVHLFAFVMVVGVLVGTYSSIYVASPLLLLFKEGGSASEEAIKKEEIAESSLHS